MKLRAHPALHWFLTSAPACRYGILPEGLALPGDGILFSNYLRKAAGLPPAAIGLIYECGGKKDMTPDQLAALIKALPVRVVAPFPIDRAISTAGGVSFDAVDDHFMLRDKPGVFIAGEMLDWEAPTGGYLLQACFSTGIRAAQRILSWTGNQPFCQGVEEGGFTYS